MITIIRASKSTEQPYFQFLRSTAQDRSLSWEARGVLAYLLSKPDDWQVQATDLAQQCKEDRVYRILNELIAARYIRRERQTDKKGRVVAWTYFVYESPLPEKPDVVQPVLEKQDSTEYRESKGHKDSGFLDIKENHNLGTDVPTEKDRKPSIVQSLDRAVARHIQEIDPDLAGKLTGQLSQAIAGVWRKKLKTDKLTAEQYNMIADTIPRFVLEYKKTDGKLQFIQHPSALESWYAKLLPFIIRGPISEIFMDAPASTPEPEPAYPDWTKELKEKQS